MSGLGSYPKIYNLGHAAIVDLFQGDVVVEEKVDGSQFSFGVVDGELFCRSKGVQLVIEAPQQMFARAVETAQALKPLLRDGWIYRGEYLQKPKHNALAYDRTPEKHVVIFDINPGVEHYLSSGDKAAEAARLGLEVVPMVFAGRVESADQLLTMLDRTSFLGGAKIEGLVVKNYARFGADGKALMGKHVTEAFKEVHKRDWKKDHKTGKDVVALLGDQYRSKARWQKAIQHLAERGELTNSPKDIGPLIKEVQRDIGEECEAEIKDTLYAWAIKDVRRRAAHGLPEWYKEQLVERQFTDPSEAGGAT